MSPRTDNPSRPVARRRWRRFILPGVMLGLSTAVVTFAIVTFAIVARITPRSDRPASHRDVQPDTPNFHKVNDLVYRGGRPSAKGLAQLTELGVRTVIDLADFKDEPADAKSAGLDYVCIPAGSLTPPRRAMVEFLRVVSQRDRGPFFVHCAQGTYRTGAMIALYRVAIEGWSKERAVAEATDPKFEFSDIGDVNKNSMAEYFAKLDIDQLRRDAGIDRWSK